MPHSYLPFDTITWEYVTEGHLAEDNEVEGFMSVFSLVFGIFRIAWLTLATKEGLTVGRVSSKSKVM